MKKIKFIICLCFTILIINGLYAQNRKGSVNRNSTRTEFENYFKNNVLELDPIEGIYVMNGYFNLYRYGQYLMQKKGEGSTVAIYKNQSNNSYEISDLYSNDKSDMSDIVISNSEAKNVYIIQKIWESGEISRANLLLSEQSDFNLNIDMPERERILVFGKKDVSGIQMKFHHDYKKIYPSYDIYSKALDEKRSFVKQEEKNIVMPSSGTGFLISKSGYVLTNYHVVENGKNIVITGVNQNFNTNYKTEIVAFDKTSDLAILKIIDESFKRTIVPIPYSFRSSKVEVGESCYTLGYPLISTMGIEVKLTVGIISSKTGYQGEISQYQISVPVQPGNSGGPLFDRNGYIIGIVNAKHAMAENASYAVKTTLIENLIELLPSDYLSLGNNTMAGLSLPQQVKLITPHIFVILVNFNLP